MASDPPHLPLTSPTVHDDIRKVFRQIDASAYTRLATLTRTRTRTRYVPMHNALHRFCGVPLYACVCVCVRAVTASLSVVVGVCMCTGVQMFV